jgi:glucose-1-phosphate cytidylyltransferase
MKVVILAGGLGTRLAEETDIKPKPMVEVGGRPIIWHIMQHYSYFGFNEFVVALGYRGEVIKRYMIDYCKLTSDLTVKIRSGDVMRRGSNGAYCDWTVDLVDTGAQTATGGRLKRLQPYLGNTTFMMTYGDGVSDVNIKDLLAFHKSHKKTATLTAINGGFFVLEPQIFDYLEGDMTWFERDPLEKLAAEKQLAAYKHPHFWQCMDTLRDKRLLEDIWNKGQAPWKTQSA